MEIVYYDDYAKIIRKNEVQFITDGLAVVVQGKKVSPEEVEKRFMEWKGYFGRNAVVVIDDGYLGPVLILNTEVERPVSDRVMIGDFRLVTMVRGRDLQLVGRKDEFFVSEAGRYHVSLQRGDKYVIIAKKVLGKKKIIEEAFKVAENCEKTYPHLPNKLPFDIKKKKFLVVCKGRVIVKEDGRYVGYAF